jgi:hypothetical protein
MRKPADENWRAFLFLCLGNLTVLVNGVSLVSIQIDVITFLRLTMGGAQVRARYASVAAKLLSSVLILLLPVVSFQVSAKAGAEKNRVVPSDFRGEIVGLQSQQDSSDDATINCDNTTKVQASPAPTLSGVWLHEQPRDIGKGGMLLVYILHLITVRDVAHYSMQFGVTS